jgi:hypothetical protein
MTRPFVLAVLMVISAISCKKKDDPSTIPATPVEKGKMELVSGDGQIGTPGMHLYDSIVIKITPNKPGDEKHYTYSFKTINSGYIIANAYMVNGSYYVKGTWEVGGDATEQATFYLYADCKQLTCSPLDSLTIHATVASPWDPVFKNTGSYGQFWDLHFSDAKHGIVVGDGSESYITTDDGGATWTSKNAIRSDFYQLAFSGGDTGIATLFACGQAGMVIRTTDGGETWQEQPVQVNNNLQKIYFLNTNVGFAAGEYGAMIRTVNGGRNWTVINTGLHFSILQIRFFSDNTGYIVSAAGEISKTIDGGVTWQPIVIADNGVFSLNKVCIKDSTIVFALQNNDVYTYTLP